MPREIKAMKSITVLLSIVSFLPSYFSLNERILSAIPVLISHSTTEVHQPAVLIYHTIHPEGQALPPPPPLPRKESKARE